MNKNELLREIIYTLEDKAEELQDRADKEDDMRDAIFGNIFKFLNAELLTKKEEK